MSELNSSKLSIYCNLGEGSIPMRHVHTHFTEQNNDQPDYPACVQMIHTMSENNRLTDNSLLIPQLHD